MRTKALLLAAAFAAAGISTSVGQVFSVNAVGYVNVPIKRGFNLVANPLDAGANNKIGALSMNLQGRTVPPDGTRIFKFRNDLNRFVDAIWDETSWVGTVPGGAQVADEGVVPGEGFFFFNPLQTEMVLTFVGTVMQGQNMPNPLPRGFSIKANIVPQAGPASDFGLPAQDGDRYFQWNSTEQRYRDWTSDEGTWVGPGGSVALPSLAVGEAFVLFRGTSSGVWTRTFDVNTPTP